DIDISTIAYAADSQPNLIDLDWLGQLGHLDLPTTFICNCVNSPASAISFTPEMMVQRFQEGLEIIISILLFFHYSNFQIIFTTLRKTKYFYCDSFIRLFSK
ncbi:unnamed protein product, partial [Hymenolepis diminuta]